MENETPAMLQLKAAQRDSERAVRRLDEAREEFQEAQTRRDQTQAQVAYWNGIVALEREHNERMETFIPDEAF